VESGGCVASRSGGAGKLLVAGVQVIATGGVCG